MNDILDELQWRGLVAQTTDESALRTALADGPITAYCGFDPTAPSLHFGNLVQLVEDVAHWSFPSLFPADYGAGCRVPATACHAGSRRVGSACRTDTRMRQRCSSTSFA